MARPYIGHAHTDGDVLQKPRRSRSARSRPWPPVLSAFTKPDPIRSKDAGRPCGQSSRNVDKTSDTVAAIGQPITSERGKTLVSALREVRLTGAQK